MGSEDCGRPSPAPAGEGGRQSRTDEGGSADRLSPGAPWTAPPSPVMLRMPLSPANMPRQLAHVAIRTYQLTLSSLIGRQCRYLPSCSEYTDDAIQAHGLWMGGWMGLARFTRCRPGGTDGLDFVPEYLPPDARWFRPWRYGRWASTNPTPVRQCEGVKPDSPLSP